MDIKTVAVYDKWIIKKWDGEFRVFFDGLYHTTFDSLVEACLYVMREAMDYAAK